MRCLYCGKELALLKRWTGGGEFCSDAHRQQYQDEYNELALTRLLQAKPPGIEALAEANAEPVPKTQDTKTSRGRAPQAEKQPEAPAKNAADAGSRNQPPKPARPEPLAKPRPEPVVAFEPELEPEPEPEPVLSVQQEPEYAVEPDGEPAPAEMASFLVESPVPVLAEVMAMARSDSEFEHGSALSLPHPHFDAWETQLVPAGPVEPAAFTRSVDYATSNRDRKLDAREFVRGLPTVEVNLDPAGETELPKSIEEPMDILIFPHPPQGSPPLWDEPWREFSFEKELGALARVAFRTTGLQDNEDSSDPIESLSETSPAPVPLIEELLAAPDAGRSLVKQPEPAQQSVPAERPEPPSTTPAAPTKPERVEAEPVPAIAKTTPVIAQPEAAKPSVRAIPRPTPPPVIVSTPTRPTFRPPSVTQNPAPKPVVSEPQKVAKVENAPIVEKPPQVVKAPAPKPTPGKVTKPMPLTLHGLAAGRGKPVQIYGAAIAGIDLHVPRSNSLPLRRVMTLGPAAVEKPVEEKKSADRTVVVKTDPRKNQPPKTDPRLPNGKGRKDQRGPESDKREPERKEAERRDPRPAAGPTSVKAPDKQAERTVAKPVEKTPGGAPERNRETAQPAQVTSTYQTPDLGLPSLNLDASGGFWSRLPVAGKAGLVLTLVAALAAGLYLMKSGGAAAATAPHVVEAPAITASEGGWITDWGAEPGVRKTREISVLRPSINMTDYRIEFEAQIESKALGWVYRAQDAKNYYVSKLEIVKPGLTPTVALVRYAVINGEEQAHSQFPLTMALRIDTLYKIRFDAVGDHFTTWVQDQKVDDWTDEHLKTGGVGLYSDRGERISLKGSLRVAPLVLKK